MGIAKHSPVLTAMVGVSFLEMLIPIVRFCDCQGIFSMSLEYSECIIWELPHTSAPYNMAGLTV